MGVGVQAGGSHTAHRVQEELELMGGVRASLNHGETEIDSHEQMTDDELCE